MPNRHARSARRRTRRSLLVLLLAASGSCRTAGIHRPDVQLRLAIEPAQVRAGDTLRLAFTVSNPAPDSVALEFAEDCRVTLVILDAWARASAEQRCMAPGAGRVVLPPGAAWTTRGTWQVPPRGAASAAGRYVIRAVLGEHHSVRAGQREFKMSHAADTVAFPVLPPSAP